MGGEVGACVLYYTVCGHSAEVLMDLHFFCLHYLLYFTAPLGLQFSPLSNYALSYITVFQALEVEH